MATLSSPRWTGRRARLTGADVREQIAGEFAGRIHPDDPVGTFANVRHEYRRGRGTYAGDADRQREGSFGDVDVRE